MSDDNRPLIIACGALVSELREVLNINGLNEAVEVRYLPANLHNRPEGIVPALREHLDGRGKRPTMVGYADCGTGGALDRMLESYPDVQRIPGAHCYEFFAGSELFAQLHDDQPGTFYLTDFLAKHFTALVLIDTRNCATHISPTTPASFCCLKQLIQKLLSSPRLQPCNLA
jgi:hypothetical protein